MTDFLAGLLVIALGAVVCLMGLRVFFVALPIWGFIAGFFVGSAAITGLLGDGFLSTGTSWVVGFLTGIVFALLSYLFWYVGVIVSAASTGGLIGSGLMSAIGVESGWIVFSVSLVGAILVAALAILIALPIYVVIVNTAFVGATAVIAGIMLVFNSINLDALSRGAAWAMIEESWFWMLAWVVVAAFGLTVQLRTITVELPEDPWRQARPAV